MVLLKPALVALVYITSLVAPGYNFQVFNNNNIFSRVLVEMISIYDISV